MPAWVSVAAVFAFVLHFGVNVPFWDEWYIPSLLEKADHDALRWADLAQQHNEHRILVPRLVMLGLARLTGWNVVGEMVFTAAHLCLLLLIVYARAARDFRFSWGRAPLWFAWIPPLILSWRQYENLTWGFQITLTLPLTLAVLTFFLLARAAETTSRTGALGAAVAAGFTASAASFSGPVGLLAWPLGLGLLALASSSRGGRKATALAWTLTGLAIYAAYFHGYTRPPRHEAIAGAQPAEVGRFFVTLVGAAFTAQPWIAFVAGATVCAVVAASTWATLRASRGRQRLFWLASVLLALAALGMVATGRAGAPQLATRSAYSTYSLFLVAACLPLTAEVVSSWAGGRRRALVAGTAALTLGVANGYLLGYRSVVPNRAALLRLREVLVDHCNRPNNEIALLYADVEVVRSAIRYLERHRYSVFAGLPEGGCRPRERDPGLRYAYGSEILFGVGGDARLFEGSGWSIPEEGFTWTDGSRAVLSLRLDEPRQDMTLRLTVSLANLAAGSDARQRVIIVVNGVEAGTLAVAGAGHYSLEIPRHLLVEGANTVALDLPDAGAWAADRRRLGIAVHSLRLDPARKGSQPFE